MNYKPLTEENCKDFPNFKYSEFKCKCKGKYCNGYPVPFSYDLASNLQKIRTHFGKSLHINSAVRCEQHNEHVGGVKHSKHKLGWAADFYVSGVSYEDLYKFVKTLPYFNYCYRIHKGGSTMHYDIKPPAYSIVVKPANRDENKDQVKVLAKQLNVREDASTKAKSVGFAITNAIYNYYEIKKDSKYEWFKIADKQWIANNGKYLEVYKKKEPDNDKEIIEKLRKEILELNKRIDELNNQIDILKVENGKLNNTITALNKENKDLGFRNASLETKIKELETEIDRLNDIINSEGKYVFKYDVKTTCNYKIHLNKGETLYIK